MTEALKTGNIKTVLSILRTIDEEKLEYRRCSHISSTSNTSATLRDVSVSAASDEPSHHPPLRKKLVPSVKSQKYSSAKRLGVLDYQNRTRR